MTTLALDSSVLPLREPGVPPDPAILAKNLAALARTSARTAELVRHSAPRTDVRFLRTDDGVVAPESFDSLGLNVPRALASRRRPLAEAGLLAGTIDVSATAAVAVMGFGAGFHVGALAQRMRRTGIIAVFEPDVPLLRGVLERVDHSAWLSDSNTAIFTDPDDAAAITASLAGVEGIVMMGLALLEHPPSLERLGDGRTRFYRNLQDVIAAVRTTVATTMVQARVTVANVLRNVGRYVSVPGISDLAGSAAGRPAIVVSAGPSLQRNIDQLARPGVRDRFTIIATQTVLKPLLARGIRPQYVVALDHSEISARFYEGLTAAELEGVTLVVEPKVSPAVPAAFPGSVRMARDPFLDTLLGPGLSREMGSLPPGATVAHLAYYLARHLGADPVVLVGQDLGFTDGQYYAAGAAIHHVWAGELNEFNSLERMEWERIRRMGAHLRRATDHLGRPICTDEQMATYLVQFERDFQADQQMGRTIIDATEGGVAKRHTVVERLGNVIDRELTRAASPVVPARDHHRVPPPARRRVEDQVRRVQRDVSTIAELSRRTVSLLTEMLAHHADQRRVGRLIEEVYAVRNRVEALTPAMELVHFLNQAGAYTRIRADRAIQLDGALTPLQRQRKEIERDITNVEGLARTTESLVPELGVAADVLADTGEPRTAPATIHAADAEAVASCTVTAIIAVPWDDGDASGLRADAFRLTLRRLAATRRVSSIIVLARRPEVWRSVAAPGCTPVPVEVIAVGSLFDERHDAILMARAPAAACWRAGLAGASIYDEVLAPEATLALMRERSISDALIVGPDWCFIDPDLTAAVIERASRGKGPHRLVFSQGAPGTAGIVVNQSLLGDLVKLRRGSSPFATIGGLLSYLPSAPSLDPIGRESCTPTPPALRDVGRRLIPDSPGRAEAFSRIINSIGWERAATTPTGDLIEMLESFVHEHALPPEEIVADLSGAHPGVVEEQLRIVKEAVAETPGLFVSLVSPVPCLDAARRVASFGARTHVRCAALNCGDAQAILGCGAGIISIDLPTDPGSPEWERAHHLLDGLVQAWRALTGPRPWLVPRLTKCDATYPVIEGFHDRWLLTTGTAAIDPSPAGATCDRIAPLPFPPAARRRFGETVLHLAAEGTAGLDARPIAGRALRDLWAGVRAAALRQEPRA